MCPTCFGAASNADGVASPGQAAQALIPFLRRAKARKSDFLTMATLFSKHLSSIVSVICVMEILHTKILVISVYCIVIALNRLYFHPLSKIPGPKLAALTSWYEFYFDVLQPGQYVFKIKELHKHYGKAFYLPSRPRQYVHNSDISCSLGSIIRIAPNEIHIDDLDFLDSIYPASNAHKRDKDWSQIRKLDVGMSTSGTVDHDLHRLRREALHPFFSKNTISRFEPVIQEKISHLVSYFDKAQASGKPVNLSDLYYGLARDVVFECSFGMKSTILEDEHAAASLRANMTELLLGVKITKQFHVLFEAIKLLPASVGKYFSPPAIKNMRDLALTVQEAIREVSNKDKQAMLAGTDQRSVFKDLLSSPTLPTSEKSLARLRSEGIMLMLAGTDATAKVLVTTHYHLLANPPMLDRVRVELSSLTPSTRSAAHLQRLPYFSACINEANRLAFGLTGRNARIASEEELSYHGYTIRPGTSMSMSTLCIHTNERVFPDPWRFQPDRWLGAQGKALQKYQFGFGRGSRRCLGMDLAYAELFLTLAAVVTGHEMELVETSEEDVRFLHDFQVAQPKLDSKGVRVSIKG